MPAGGLRTAITSDGLVVVNHVTNKFYSNQATVVCYGRYNCGVITVCDARRERPWMDGLTDGMR